MVMKMKLILVLVAVLSFGGVLPQAAQGQGIYVSVGDRPYYHGRSYYSGGFRHVWVPGHWEYRRHGRVRVWVRGHYVRVFSRDRQYAGYGYGYRDQYPGYGYGLRPGIGLRSGWGW